MILNRLKIFIDINLILKKNCGLLSLLKENFVTQSNIFLCKFVLKCWERERERMRERDLPMYSLFCFINSIFIHIINSVIITFWVGFFKWIFLSSKLTKRSMRLNFLNSQYIFDRYHRINIDYHYFLFYK